MRTSTWPQSEEGGWVGQLNWCNRVILTFFFLLQTVREDGASCWPSVISPRPRLISLKTEDDVWLAGTNVEAEWGQHVLGFLIYDDDSLLGKLANRLCVRLIHLARCKPNWYIFSCIFCLAWFFCLLTMGCIQPAFSLDLTPFLFLLQPQSYMAFVQAGPMTDSTAILVVRRDSFLPFSAVEKLVGSNPLSPPPC